MALNTPVGRFRVVSLIEGISFLVLLFIAMPLKYWADSPQAVAIVGTVHGVLFALYFIALAHAWISARWPITRILAAIAAAFIPFGTFILDARIRKNP
ncbi:DUF3817 domain-containing protein [Paenibacillus sp. GCM10027626]|uniref:DUF3817 domain-containing protein n=1 Tax=Paenibacillus sp. GCM10027626 TaxID=3273411 RepID=UPI003626A18B